MDAHSTTVLEFSPLNQKIDLCAQAFNAEENAKSCGQIVIGCCDSSYLGICWWTLAEEEEAIRLKNKVIDPGSHFQKGRLNSVVQLSGKFVLSLFQGDRRKTMTANIPAYTREH